MSKRKQKLESGDLPESERKGGGRNAAQDLIKAYQRELGDEPTDTVREYLRSIGQHPLLSAAQEQELGRSVERWMQLKQIRAALQKDNDRPPSTAEVAAVVFRVVASERELVEALATDLGEDPEGRQLPELLSDDSIRGALDAPLKEPSRDAVAAAMGIPDVDAAPRISALSKHVALLPEHAITRLDFAARPEGNGHVDEATVSAETLDDLERELERWWDSIERLGQDASELLTNSNLRLVVSVAPQIPAPGPPAPGPDPGRQPGPDAGRGEVRPPQGFQIQHLRHLVDSAGGDPCPWPIRAAPSGYPFTSSRGSSSLTPPSVS